MDNRRFLKIVLIVIIGLISASAKNYYVSPAGDDTNDGSVSNPWKHIAFATCGGSYACPCSTNNPNRITAGDTLFVRGGKYSENDIRMTNTGTATACIVIKAYQNEKDTIDCQKSKSGFNAGTSQTNNYVVIDGLFIKDPLQAGIRIGENYKGDHWIIKNCRFEGLVQSDNSACVFLSASNNTLIENCVMVGIDNTNLNDCGVQIFRGDGSDTIRNCDISHFGEGIFYKHCSLGNATTVIKNNFIHDNKAKGIWISSDHITMQNNLIVNSSGGINLWEDAGGTGGSFSSIFHNTVYNCGYPMVINSGGQIGAMSGDHGATHDTVKNNVLLGTNSEMGSLCIWPYPDPNYDSAHAVVSNFNCYYNTGIYPDKVMREYRETYTLLQWQNKYPTRDNNSVQGLPTFSNFSGSPAAIVEFKLLSGYGYRSASDGTDMGANVDSVGLQKGPLTVISNHAAIRKFTKTGFRCIISLQRSVGSGNKQKVVSSKEQLFDICGRRLPADRVHSSGNVIILDR